MYFAYATYRQGFNEFEQDYRDPASDHTTPYPPAPYDSGPTGYQQSPYSNNQPQAGEYQPPTYWRTGIQTHEFKRGAFFFK